MKKENRNKILRLSIDLVAFFLLLIVDQITKYYAVLTLKGQAPLVLWKNVFELNYLENSGAAFGMLKNQKPLFIVITIIVLLAIGYILFKTPLKKKYAILHFCLILIASGAVGNNLIDRLRLNYVIDFFYIKLINFAIFNVADLFVCIGTFLLVIIILFIYKEDDLEFLSFKSKVIREIKE